MKIAESLRKVGAVTGSALMLGMTLGSAATLADFPRPFVDQDGQVQSQIVVGNSGNQADVVGAINVAAALGNSAVTTDQRTVSGTAPGWTAADGQTLDTRNDNLRFLDDLDAVRDTLTRDDLSTLADTTFTDDDGDDTDIDYYLYPGSQQVTFGKPADRDDEDPVLHVENPADVDASTNLYRVQANFADDINFTDSAVQGEDIELFGTEYTVSEDTTSSELVLFGATQTLSLSTSGQTSGTITVDDADHTIEIDGVNDGGVIYRVDGGSFVQDQEGDTFTVDGETVRIDDVIDRVDDAGSASFEVGSEELHLENDAAIEDGDGDDIEGTHVGFNGDASLTDPVDAVSTIDISIGADDDDREYVMAGESYSHDLFGNVAFRFGGLDPDTADADTGELSLDPDGDDTITTTFTDDAGDTATVAFIHTADDGATFDLADGDGDGFVVVEGDPVAEDEYVPTDAGGFTHLWEVTGIDRDATGSLDSGDEATIDLQDAVSGQSVEIDLDAQEAAGGYGDGDEYYSGAEIIDGQTYHVVLEGGNSQFSDGDGDAEFKIAWGTDADHASGTDTVSISTGGDASGATTQYPSLELDSGARLAFYDPGQTASGLAIGTNLVDFQAHEFFVDDATQSEEDANGYGDGDPIAGVLNDHDGTPDIASGDDIIAFGTDARFYDADSSGGYTVGDEVYLDDDDDDVYTGQADTQLAGTTLGSVGAGTAVTPTNPWPGLGHVRFYDAGTSNLWEAGSDLIVTDDDADEDFTGQGDTALDADGSTTTGAGTPVAATGDALVPFQSTDRVVYTGTLTGQYALWLDASGSDNDQYDSGTDTVLYDADTILTDGDTGTGAEDNADLKYVDEGGSGAYADGDEIWLDQGGNGTVSDAADTVLAGSASPAEGTDLTATNPFTTAPQVAFFDDGDNAWQAGNDLILTDPHNGGTVSEAADTHINRGDDDTVDVSDDEGDNDLDEAAYFAVDVDDSAGINTGDEVAAAVEETLAGGDTVSVFPSTTRHTGSQPYVSSETVVSDADDSDTYTSGDTVFGSTAGTVRSYSSDATETDGLTSAAQTRINGLSGPASIVIEEADDDDEQEVYTAEASWDSDEIELGTPVFSEAAKAATADLESDDDVTAGYDVYGAYSWHDSDGQGEAYVAIPDGQAAAGAGFTTPGGSLGTGTTTSDAYDAFTGTTALPDMARLDTGITSAQRGERHLILVGGPAVNRLVADLASEGDTWTQDEWSEHEDEALLQVVNDAFAQDTHALIVAGYGADDTRAAARYISNHAEHAQELADAGNRLVLTADDYPADR